MTTYIIYNTPPYRALIRQPDGASIPFDERNADYREYLAWVNEGNEAQVIDIATPQSTPTVEERLEAAEALIDMMLEAGGEASNG